MISDVMKIFFKTVSNIFPRKLTARDLVCPRGCEGKSHIKSLRPLVTYCETCDEIFIDTVATGFGFIPQSRKDRKVRNE